MKAKTQEPRHRRPTLKDVAAHSGVSFQTVSLVINHPERVHDRTRTRVLDTMKALHYAPNLAARGLRKISSKTIACVALSAGNRPQEEGRPMLQDTWQSEVLMAFGSVADRSGYALMSKTVSLDDHEGVISRIYQEGRVDGVIVLPIITEDQFLLDLHRQGVPLVVFGSAHPALSSVTQADRQSAWNLVTYMVERGCRRIGFVRWAGDSAVHSSGQERYLGYLEATRHFGLATSERWTGQGDMSISSGYQAVQAVMGGFSPQRAPQYPDALILANDRMAIGGLKACHDLQVRVPQDVSLAGFDNSEYGRYTLPPLTSVSGPIAEMAARTFEVLLELTGSRQAEPTLIQETFQTQLVIRESIR
ncbi:LacI family DNA-binding transcriptional regulator [Deinococcus sp.]|uniref:LacI family DNA-binding transcriptional regulator n=1 Tax=Deinococcus sp. TaxID=47478 RepID=UPI0025E48C94|nr:LacI family DNA-binding transcriptional regulator [Deinococcus sp.]